MYNALLAELIIYYENWFNIYNNVSILQVINV